VNHVSLFSGIGGIDLAAEWAGFTTIAFCESDPYCQKILNLRWPGVPICEDVHDMGREWLDEHGIGAITLVSGGLPCQPFSVAGKRRGKEDDRYLWPEMLRVIQELKPRWVLGENVVGFIRMGLDEALSDLEGCGYETQAFVIPACAVDAPHLRERVFIVAHRNGERFDESGAILRGDAGGQTDHGITDGENGYVSAAHLGQDVAHARLQRPQEHEEQTAGLEQPGQAGAVAYPAGGQPRQQETGDWGQGTCGGGQDVAHTQDPDRWGASGEVNPWRGDKEVGGCGEGRRTYGTIESCVGRAAPRFSDGLDGLRERWADGSWEDGTPRVATGVKDRVNRLKALGNAVVPQQVYPILKAIAEIERSLCSEHGK